MLLALNLGNTNITFGLFDRRSLVKSWKVSIDAIGDVDSILVDISDIDGVILASVVPQITPHIISMLSKLKLPAPLIVTRELSFPIKLDINRPQELGADLVANMVAASASYSKPIIILDSGTATSFCVVSKDGEFTGAIIAPGFRMMAKSLNENTALLPEVEIVKPDVLVGKNTIESILSGVYFGYIGLVNEILRKLKYENPEAKIIGTGGNLKTFISEIKNIDEVNYTLNLEGLRIIYELNK